MPGTARRWTRRQPVRAAVRVYWIVDLAARVVEEWRPDADQPAVHDQTLVGQPDPALPALMVDLPTYFESVLGA